MRVCERYLSKLDHPEEIIDLLGEGIQTFDNQTLRKLFGYIQIFMILHKPKESMHAKLLKMCVESRNTTSFFIKWHPEYLVNAINYQAKYSFAAIICMENLPQTMKFSKMVVQSKILKNCLKKFNATKVTESQFEYAVGALASVLLRYIHCKQFKVPEDHEKHLADAHATIKFICDNEPEDDISGPIWVCRGALHVLLYREEAGDMKKLMIRARDMNIKLAASTRRKNCQANCFNPKCSKTMKEKAKYCSKCCYVSYCSQKCQKKHFKTHKKHCKIIFKIGKNLRKIMEFEMERLEEISEEN